MKHATKFLAVVGLFAAVACSKDKSENIGDGIIKFSASVSKATDTAFEDGDQISLFAGQPINEANVKMTYAASTLTPAKNLYWADGQTAATEFKAVYPYNPAYTSGDVDFEVKTDQSTSAGYKASDLMTAVTSQTPGNTVALNFTHRLSKLCINITNKTAYTVTGVSANAVKTKFNCGSEQSSGSATVYAYKISEASWVMILAPQTAGGKITVQTTGGNFDLSGDFVLEAGKESTCNLTVSDSETPDPEAAAFSCTVSDWGTGQTFSFTQDGFTPTPPSGNTIFSQEFKADGQGSFEIVDKTIPEDISYVWLYDSKYGMKASAYVNQTNYATESWLISPEIDLSAETSAHLEFKHAARFFSNISSEAEVVISKDNGASWTKLTVPVYPDGSNWTFISSGDIDLSAYAGNKIKLAFKYTSSSSASGTWEIEYVKITRAASGSGDDAGEGGGQQETGDGEIVVGNVITINALSTDLNWTSDTHSTYGAGFKGTGSSVTVAYYKYNSANDLVEPSSQYPNIKVYKDAVLIIKLNSGAAIKGVKMKCSGTSSKSYTADMDVIGGGTISADESTYTLSWTGSATELVAAASVAQVRPESLEITF